MNDIIPYQLAVRGTIDMVLFNGIYTDSNWSQSEDLNKVAIKFPISQAMADVDDNRKTDDKGMVQYSMNPNSKIRIAVFGHTRNSKIISSNNYQNKNCIYANSGTWGDNNPHLTKMNFVVIRPQTSDAKSQSDMKLYNFMNEVVSLIAVDELHFEL